jgi:hypothetical protein
MDQQQKQVSKASAIRHTNVSEREGCRANDNDASDGNRSDSGPADTPFLLGLPLLLALVLAFAVVLLGLLLLLGRSGLIGDHRSVCARHRLGHRQSDDLGFDLLGLLRHEEHGSRFESAGNTHDADDRPRAKLARSGDQSAA